MQSWSVPPGLIAPQAARPETDVTPPDAGPITDDGDWPGVAPLAGWFLPTPADGPADNRPLADQADQADQGDQADRAAASAEASDDAGENVTGEWFASPAPEPDESPVSWHEGMDAPGPGAEPPDLASEQSGEPAAPAPAPRPRARPRAAPGALAT